LASIKQTEEGLKETFEKEAEKRIKGFLVLKEVGKKENIEVKDEEIEEEFEKAMKNYSKEQLNKIDSTQLKEYTKGVIYNEKVFEKLENSSL
jgi:trigger factor